MKITWNVLTSLLTAITLMAPPVFAQIDSGSSDQPVTLSEFTVTGKADDGYGATEAMTGSRVAEKIKNLSYPVNVITSEFLRDFAFYDLDENFNFASSFTNSVTDNGTQRIRGLGTTKSLRNGFQRIGMLAAPVNIDRVEIIKGASAAIYGEIQPAGMVNIVSKRPKTKPGYRLSTSAGSNNLFSADAEATGPLGRSGKTAYLVTAGYFGTGYAQQYATLRQRVVSGSISHQFSAGTSLLLEMEHIARKSPVLSVVPVTNDSSIVDPTKRQTRLATFQEVGNFNFIGPWARGDREVNSAILTFEHRFSSVWSLRAGASYSNRGNWNQTMGTPVLQLAGTTKGTVARAPTRGGVTEDIGQGQIDVLAQYTLLNGALRNRTLMTLDYFSNYHTDPSWGLPTPNNANTVGSLTWLLNRGLFQQNMAAFDPNANYATPEFNLQNFPTISRNRHNRTDIGGAFLRQQAAVLGDRLFLVGGIRFDNVRYWLADKAAASQSGNPSRIVTERGHTQVWSPSAGANLRVADHIRAFANYAKTFFANTQNRTAGAGNASNERGYGWDYGFKVDLFEERLNFTIGGYWVVRNNVTVNDTDPVTGLTVSRPVGNTLSQGIELDGTWRIRDSLTTLFGYGKLDSAIKYAGVDREVVGRPTTATADSNAYLALRWALLKRLNVTFGVTYTGKSYPFSEAGGISTAGQILTHNGQRDVAIPGYYATRAGASYTWHEARSRVSQTLGVNIINAFDQRYVTLNRRFVDPRSFSATYTIRY